jgi:hypothetical protein
VATAPSSSFGGGFGGAPATATATTVAPSVGKFGKVIPMDDQPAL